MNYQCFACPGPGVSEIRPGPAAGWTPPATVADITRPSAATVGEYDHVAAAAYLMKHARSAAADGTGPVGIVGIAGVCGALPGPPAA
jgi:hypothetical protein